MEFISSDTNIWIDFSLINKLHLPFKLPYVYLMDKDAIEDELLSPTNLKNDLIYFGLKQIEIDINELLLAEEYGKNIIQISFVPFCRIFLHIVKRYVMLLKKN